MEQPIKGAPFRFRITPGFCIAAAVLFLNESWAGLTALYVLAGLCHETGHLLAARALHLPVRGITLSLVGAELDITRRCSYLGELFLLSCGPFVNFILAFSFCRIHTQSAMVFSGINLLFACFNLLPVPPLDGGEIVYLLTAWLLNEHIAWYFSEFLALLGCFAMLFLGLVLWARGNPSLLILGIWMTAGVFQKGGQFGKRNCKRS